MLHAAIPFATLESAVCASCRAPLAGPFCARCGEEIIDHHALTVRHFVKHSLIHEFTHVDGKIFRSLWFVLTRPGFLSSEYFAERRRAYMNPIRLLLTAVILFGLLAPAGAVLWFRAGKVRLALLPPGAPTGETIEDIAKQLDFTGALNAEYRYFETRKDLKSEKALEKFRRALETYGEVLSFLNVLLVAVALYLLFRKQRRYFVEHVVFSLHLAAFVLLFSTLAFVLYFVLTRIPAPMPVQKGLLTLFMVGAIFAQTGYLAAAVVRFYFPHLPKASAMGWGAQAWRVAFSMLVVLLANSVFSTIVYAIGGAVALARL